MNIEDYVKILHGDMSSKYEMHIAEYIDRLPRGSVFYDLGACRGLFSLYAAYKSLEVYAFEADKHNYTELLDNVKYNKALASRIRVFNVGVIDQGPKKIKLYYNKHLAGIHHKSLDVKEFAGDKDMLRGDNFEAIDIDANSLDNLIKQNGIPWPEHIKVDIDGSEYSFIKGAYKALSAANSIIIEIYKGNNVYKKIIEDLLSFGFRLVEEYCIEQPGLHGYFNVEFSK